MIIICSYTDAAIGKHGGGVGIVIRGYVQGVGAPDAFCYETYLPLPVSVSQLDAELFSILVGVEQVGCVAASNGLKPEDFYLKIISDSKSAVQLVHNGPKAHSAKTRVLIKRIIRLVAGKYSKPPGGGSEFLDVQTRNTDPALAEHVPFMVRAHTLSRTARTLAIDLKR